MTAAQWVGVAGLLMLGGVLAAGWLGVQFARAPYLPPSFDEHAATAAALLQPDAPLFTHAEQQQTGLADHWRTYIDSLPTTHEREYH